MFFPLHFLFSFFLTSFFPFPLRRELLAKLFFKKKDELAEVSPSVCQKYDSKTTLSEFAGTGNPKVISVVPALKIETLYLLSTLSHGTSYQFNGQTQMWSMSDPESNQMKLY